MIKLAQHYVDPRLVALYDIENTRGADTDFYVRLAAELDARTIIELGCGTGRLTFDLVGDGRRVIGTNLGRNEDAKEGHIVETISMPLAMKELQGFVAASVVRGQLDTSEFTVPPAFAESMYERDKMARSLAGRIVVVGAGK